MRRVAVINRKGGVGKSTTVANLAASLATRGQRVLVVDFDAQGNASQFLGLSEAPLRDGGTAELVAGQEVLPRPEQLIPGLALLPASEGLNGLERRLYLPGASGAWLLDSALGRLPDSYDIVLVDCGPTSGAMAANAVVACPEVLIPVELAHAAAMGALAMRAFVDSVRIELQPKARVMGVLGTFFKKEVTPVNVLSNLRAIFGDAVLRTVIHRSAAVRDAAGRGLPIVLSHPKSRGAMQYQQLADEVLERGK